MNLEERLREEIERRARAGDLERAARLLGYAKEVGLCVSEPEIFERELAADPFAGHLYRCRARIKWRAGLREESVGDMARALLVCDVFLDELGRVREVAESIPVAPWVRDAIESVVHRVRGERTAEWRRLLAARDQSTDMAVHVRIAQVQCGPVASFGGGPRIVARALGGATTGGGTLEVGAEGYWGGGTPSSTTAPHVYGLGPVFLHDGSSVRGTVLVAARTIGVPAALGVIDSQSDAEDSRIALRASHVGALALLILGFVLVDVPPLWHTDVWTHLKYGRWIAAHLPRSRTGTE
jgi:hypothetical protein